MATRTIRDKNFKPIGFIDENCNGFSVRNSKGERVGNYDKNTDTTYGKRGFVGKGDLTMTLLND